MGMTVTSVMDQETHALLMSENLLVPLLRDKPDRDREREYPRDAQWRVTVTGAQP